MLDVLNPAAALAGGLLLAAVLAIAVRLRRRSEANARVREAAAPSPAIVYRDAPTIRLRDAHRVDRLRKIFRLRIGEHADVLEKLGSLPVRFRIALKGVATTEHGAAAHVAVDLAGAALCGGPLVRELARNEFLLPRASRDESRSSLHHMQESGDSLEFTRIKVRHVELANGSAEIDVLQISGHWPSEDG